jgi:hypothetical protein
MKSGNLNFLEPSGPLQACKGTALTFTKLKWRNLRKKTVLWHSHRWEDDVEIFIKE